MTDNFEENFYDVKPPAVLPKAAKTGRQPRRQNFCCAAIGIMPAAIPTDAEPTAQFHPRHLLLFRKGQLLSAFGWNILCRPDYNSKTALKTIWHRSDCRQYENLSGSLGGVPQSVLYLKFAVRKVFHLSQVFIKIENGKNSRIGNMPIVQ